MNSKEIPPIYILSGGSGASGEQIVQTVLAQFPQVQVPVVSVTNISRKDQVDAAVAAAQENKGFIVHTMVNTDLNRCVVKSAHESGVLQVDLMNTLIEKITEVTGERAIGHPGLYRKLRKAYFERVEAIEYTMAHDDSKDPDGWGQAEIILIGVSRVGKTPLSLYLSVLGWRVANAALIPGIEPHVSLFKQDKRRLIGLTMQPGQLVIHRQQRQSRLGSMRISDYTNPEAIHEEVAHFYDLMKQEGITVIDVTDKAIESSADEVMEIITRRLGDQRRNE